ncbi:rRNA maturation RNase YbeY [bacterium]
MKIQIYNKQKKFPINSEQISKIIRKFFKSKYKNANLSNYQIYVSFVSKKKIIELNKIVFTKDYLTDVISVPVEPFEENIIDDVSPKVFGEIFICPYAANLQRKEYNNTLKQELNLLVIHGLLHIIGYDDIDENDRKIMRKQEIIMLKICS